MLLEQLAHDLHSMISLISDVKLFIGALSATIITLINVWDRVVAIVVKK